LSQQRLYIFPASNTTHHSGS